MWWLEECAHAQCVVLSLWRCNSVVCMCGMHMLSVSLCYNDAIMLQRVYVVGCRSVAKLKKLQRLDLGNNEIESLVSVCSSECWPLLYSITALSASRDWSTD